MPAASASAAPEDYLFIIPDSGANLWGFNGLTTRCHCGRATRRFPPIFTALIDLGGLETNGQLINLVRVSVSRDLVGRSSKHLPKRSFHSSRTRETHPGQEQRFTNWLQFHDLVFQSRKLALYYIYYISIRIEEFPTMWSHDHWM